MLSNKYLLGFDCEIGSEKDDKTYDLTAFPNTLEKFFQQDVLKLYVSCSQQLELEPLDLTETVNVAFNKKRIITNIMKPEVPSKPNDKQI